MSLTIRLIFPPAAMTSSSLHRHLQIPHHHHHHDTPDQHHHHHLHLRQRSHLHHCYCTDNLSGFETNSKAFILLKLSALRILTNYLQIVFNPPPYGLFSTDYIKYFDSVAPGPLAETVVRLRL
jgi:hypothetical protein